MGVIVNPVFVVLSSKTWHDKLFEDLRDNVEATWIRLKEFNKFNLENLDQWKPDMIFIPHWSYIIPEEIFLKYDCIVFHMTDLPYGRGGSPLQNLITRGHNKTKISALKVVKELDAGPVYLKRELSLDGNATEIFQRASSIIQSMIREIIDQDIKPIGQDGVPVLFKRRTPSESNLADVKSKEEAYDYIRMLDAEGYPHAFLETENLRFEFTEAIISENGQLKANVRIFKK
jgi:methionyl-tRNA formyltransferase